jgi:hypothetical protein
MEDSKPFKEDSYFSPTIPFKLEISGQAIIHHTLTIEEEPTHLTQPMCLGGWPIYWSPWTSTESKLHLSKDKEVLEALEEVLEQMLPK